jgi:hypothetical protein
MKFAHSCKDDFSLILVTILKQEKHSHAGGHCWAKCLRIAAQVHELLKMPLPERGVKEILPFPACLRRSIRIISVSRLQLF